MVVLKRGNRLSITPVEAKHWKQILKILGVS
jgi:predicted RNA-binding protein with PUA-like domain